MARCYANENFPLPAVEALRVLGHDILTTQVVGKSGSAIPDDEVLRYAHAQNRVLPTFNRKDFIRSPLAGKIHAGILACRFDPDFPTLAKRIHRCLQETDALAGQLLKVNRNAGEA